MAVGEGLGSVADLIAVLFGGDLERLLASSAAGFDPFASTAADTADTADAADAAAPAPPF